MTQVVTQIVTQIVTKIVTQIVTQIVAQVVTQVVTQLWLSHWPESLHFNREYDKVFKYRNLKLHIWFKKEFTKMSEY